VHRFEIVPGYASLHPGYGSGTIIRRPGHVSSANAIRDPYAAACRFGSL